MFEVNELYRHKSNKKRESVVRVLDTMPDPNNMVRVQFIERGRPVEYFDLNKSHDTNQRIEFVGAKGIRETIVELVSMRETKEAKTPRIDYVDIHGREHTGREYSFSKEAAEAIENLEGIITYTCHGCSQVVCIEICDTELETDENDCELCGVHTTVTSKATCPACKTQRDIELYDS